MTRWSDVWQKVGLRIINGLARSVPVDHELIAYGDSPRHYLDWYRDPVPGMRPTVLFFYGGNWQSGRRQDYRFVADTLMTMGSDVVVPDYRLYPHVRFADILLDARMAVEAVLARLAPEHQLILMGHSAGAQLGALLTLDAALLSDPGRIAGFIGLAGPYDFYPFTEDAHWELFGPEPGYPASQPVNFVRADAPPLFLLHGADDTRVRRGHSKSLMEKQQAVGGRAERRVYPGMGHVDLVLAFSRLHRRGNPVVQDVAAIIGSLGAAAGTPQRGPAGSR
ncbi:MAG: alpha/beta hydrolase [Pseudomonadales bacterium]|nr:alpha/beta hydrolase [Pseudomonadales bacterium]